MIIKWVFARKSVAKVKYSYVNIDCLLCQVISTHTLASDQDAFWDMWKWTIKYFFDYFIYYYIFFIITHD